MGETQNKTVFQAMKEDHIRFIPGGKKNPFWASLRDSLSLHFLLRSSYGSYLSHNFLHRRKTSCVSCDFLCFKATSVILHHQHLEGFTKRHIFRTISFLWCNGHLSSVMFWLFLKLKNKTLSRWFMAVGFPLLSRAR